MIKRVLNWIAWLRSWRRLHDELWDAMRRRDAQAVEAALKAGADIDAAMQSNEPDPPLVFASYAGSCELVDLLLRYGADANLSGMNDITPLMAAASQGHADVVKTLLQHGADMSHRDRKGWTVREHAEWCRDPDNREAVLGVLQQR